MKLYHFVCAAVLAVAPIAAMAQTTATQPTRNQNEAADAKPGYGAKSNPATPGATGKAVVPGTHSSPNNNRAATMEQRKSSITNGGK